VNDVPYAVGEPLSLRFFSLICDPAGTDSNVHVNDGVPPLHSVLWSPLRFTVLPRTTVRSVPADAAMPEQVAVEVLSLPPPSLQLAATTARAQPAARNLKEGRVALRAVIVIRAPAVVGVRPVVSVLGTM
jgi:hypothetical protein